MANTNSRATAPSSDACVIGPETAVRGALSGQEDLVIEGRVEGSVSLAGHLIVAETGEVEADLDIESIAVLGHVRGDIVASRSITIERGARVSGNVRAPRVIINDGAHFDGAVEMEVDLPDDLRKAAR
ncbi:MAG: polymer-forming cytoskeletal protein [Nannocystaceae bacterium]|nr:polymer-forming cytoskeletal protein [bacterium]